MIDYGLGVWLDTLDKIPCELLREWRNNYSIYRYCRQNDLIPVAAHNRWAENLSERDKMYLVCVEGNTENTFFPVGVCGLTNMDLINRRAEFSLYIRPGEHRKGNGALALKTLFSHGFNSYGLEVIWGETYSHNPAQHLFEKLGMHLDGIRRRFYFRDGQWVDAKLYSLLKDEWKLSQIFDGARIQKCSS